MLNPQKFRILSLHRVANSHTVLRLDTWLRAAPIPRTQKNLDRRSFTGQSLSTPFQAPATHAAVIQFKSQPLATSTGIEPATCWSGASRSIQLSYEVGKFISAT